MSDVYCLSCSWKVTRRMHAVCCDRCDRWQHRVCKSGGDTGISAADYRSMVNGHLSREWFCGYCQESEVSEVANSTAASLVLPDRRVSASPIRDINSTYVVRSTDDVTPDNDGTQPLDRSEVQVPMDEEAIPSAPGFPDRSFHVQVDFERPVVSLDDSLPDRQLNGCIPEDVTVTYEVVEGGTKRGGKKLLSSDGYTYTVRRVKNDRTYWSCSMRGKNNTCSANVRQFRDIFTPSNGHQHPADPGAGKKTKIAAKVKSIARENVFQPAAGIVETVMLEETTEDDINLPRLDLLTRAANRHRQQMRPKDPMTLEFEIDEDYVGEDFTLDDVRVGDQRHILFATKAQLQLLATAKRWFVDGTFKLVKKPFAQLWTVHAFVRKEDDTKQVPLVYVLMSRRAKEDYVEVLQAIIGRMEREPLVEFIMMDFEAASWQAARHVLPGRVIKGCVFHWNQRVYRKIQERGLATAYAQKADVYQFLRKVMSLPYLPTEHITPAFRSLQAQAEAVGGPVQEVTNYVEATWIEGRVWRPENWSVFRQTVRTNNDVEGWHRRINGKGGRPDLQFYVMVPLLRHEAKTVDLQVRLVSEQLLTRVHRTKYAQLHARLFDAWDKYEDDDMTTTQLLRVCSHINGLGATSTRDPIHDEDAF